jgi:hypothetical protein
VENKPTGPSSASPSHLTAEPLAVGALELGKPTIYRYWSAGGTRKPGGRPPTFDDKQVAELRQKLEPYVIDYMRTHRGRLPYVEDEIDYVLECLGKPNEQNLRRNIKDRVVTPTNKKLRPKSRK